MRNHLAVTLACCLLIGVPALSQQHQNSEIGFQPGKSASFPEIDSVNQFNGNLTLTIPIGQQYPGGGGLSYGFTLIYNSNPWEYTQRRDGASTFTQAQVSEGSNAGFGWRLGLVGSGGLISPTSPRNTSGKWVWEAFDGSQHVFYDTLHPGDPVNANVRYTRDGSYIRMSSGTTTDVEMPDGTIHRGWQILDRFGNALTPSAIGWGIGGAWTRTKTTYQDSVGRSHHVQIYRDQTLANGGVEFVDLAGFNNTRSVYTFTYTTMTVNRGCGDNDPQTSASVNVQMLSSVTFPDGSVYSMPSYNATPGCSDAGLIRQLRLPTLGYLEWDYRTYSFTNPQAEEDSIRHRYSRAGIGKRRMRDASGALLGEWSYETFLGGRVSPCPIGANCLERDLVNTTVTPPGDRIASYFSSYIEADTGPNPEGWNTVEYGLPLTRNPARQTSPGRHLSSEIRNASGTLLRSRFVKYELELPAERENDTNRRLKSHRTVFDDDGGIYADTDYSSFDGLGHFRQRSTNGNFDSGNARTHFTNFNPNAGTLTVNDAGAIQPGNFSMLSSSAPWVLGTFTEQTQSEDGVTARTEYCFDSSTGALQRRRIRKADAQGAADLLYVAERDSAGNLTAEQYLGGDTQSIYLGNLCSLPLLTPQYRIEHSYQYGYRRLSQYAGSIKLFDIDPDFNTGLPGTSRDPASDATYTLSTSYEYDSLGRLTWRKSALEGWTQFLHVNATSPAELARQETKYFNYGATWLHAHDKVTYDAFGRVWKEKQLLADGSWSTREHGHNAQGWKTFVSEVEGTDSPVNRTSFEGFDPFGRPSTVRTPDQKLTTFVHTGQRTLTRTVSVGTTRGFESPATTIERYDRQGRLYQVQEDSGPNGESFATTYFYDVGGRLSLAQKWGWGLLQQRYFTYDNRGFLASETLPEKGLDGNGTVTYSMYDARGHAKRRIEGSGSGLFDLDFTYDSAERLTRVSRTSGQSLKDFEYSSGNLPSDLRNGKLSRATRHNWNSNGIYSSVVEDYFYGGRGGRVSRRDTATNWGVSFTQSFNYDELGRSDVTWYPYCSVGCSGGGNAVQSAYTNGFLTSISGYASFSYHPNGLLSQVRWDGTSFTWNQQNDPQSMPRRASIYTTGGNSSFYSGTYGYDGAGNIVSIGSDYYIYDKVNRLKEGSAYQAGGWTQQSTYDHFGNRKSSSTYNYGSLYSSQTIDASFWTNRLNGVPYDESGNQKTVGVMNLFYDSFNMVDRVVGGGRNELYVYTVDDERILSYNMNTGSTVWRVRDLDGKVLSEFSGGLWRKNYLYRGDGTLLMADLGQGGQKNLFAPDHLGTPRLITDNYGNQLSRHTYLPFGGEATWSGASAEPMKFTGHERDFCCDGTSDVLDYMHARHYNPNQGRFFSVDPIFGSLSSPQRWNRYSYVMNNPLRYTDPTGMDLRERPTYSPSELADAAFWDESRQLGQEWFAAFRRAANSPNPITRHSAISLQAYDAFIDGAIPFVDPLEAAGLYDSDNNGLSYSQFAGQMTAAAAATLATSGANSLFGGGTWMNKGQYFRIGHSFDKGNTWFAIRGQLIDKAFGKEGRHIYMWIIRRGR